MDTPTNRLPALSAALEQGASLSDTLKQCVDMAAQLLDVERCVVVLPGDAEAGEAGEAMARVYAGGGAHAATAGSVPLDRHAPVYGPVRTAGAACLIDGLAAADCVAMQHAAQAGPLIAAPIAIHGKLVGVVSAGGRAPARPFGQADLDLVRVVGLLIGKCIQTVQLQHVLASRFAQLALLRETRANLGEAMEKAVENPDQLARILAKSFFREMTRSGFSSGQIINASSEIIAQLSSSLDRHSKRLGKLRKPE